jgi:hypothetical protein
MMAKEQTKHYDLMGKELAKDSFVVAELNKYRSFELCVIDKVNPKMLRVRSISINKWGKPYTTNKYPTEMMIVDNQEDITMYILKNSKVNT